VAALFEALGTDVVATVDVHNLAAFQNAFRCRTEHLEAAGLFVAEPAPALADREVVVVAPDEGGIKRADAFRLRLSAALGKPVGVAFCEKYRRITLTDAGQAVLSSCRQLLELAEDVEHIAAIATGNRRASCALRHPAPSPRLS
jgi:phosphoribosylpyrophosphate synthetase